MRSKVTIVGAGNVGATAAQRIFDRGYADVVLVDIVDGLPQGKALDMLESGPILGSDAQILGTNTYEETADSDVVVVTSGIARKPGMSRDDLLLTNQKIVSSVVSETSKYSPESVHVIEQREVLKHDPGAGDSRAAVAVRGVVSEDLHRAGRRHGPGRAQQSGEQRQRQGLSGPARTHEQDELSSGDLRAGVLEQRAILYAELEVLDANGRITGGLCHRSSPMTPVRIAWSDNWIASPSLSSTR